MMIKNNMKSEIKNLSRHPELISEFYRIETEAWPEFMHHDKVAQAYWKTLLTVFPDFQVIMRDEKGNSIGTGHSIPIYWDGALETLPDNGWDGMLENGILNYKNSIKPNALSALSIAINPKFKGHGLSKNLIIGLKNLAAEKLMNNFIVPLRPSMKCEYQLIPIENYIKWKNKDGLPFDPWLRTHCKLGGRMLGIAHKSMEIVGTVADWEKWTQKKFPGTGDHIVPGSLVPIKIDFENDIGSYIEPNIWLSYKIDKS